jgi:hypothetical protein
MKTISGGDPPLFYYSKSPVPEKEFLYSHTYWQDTSFVRIVFRDHHHPKLSRNRDQAVMDFAFSFGLAQIHPRMPVILPEKHHAAWLGETENGNLKELLVPPF